MMRKTYMVAVTVKPPITIYYEIIAKNAKDAIKQTKKDIGSKITEEYVNDWFVDEIGDNGIDLLGEKIELNCEGLASKFHTEAECELCTKVKNGNKKKTQK